MTTKLDHLIHLLSLEKIDDNLFRGESRDPGWGRVFGGQVLGQSLSAAAQTAPEDRFIHSFHSYFLLPGDVNHPIIFDVERVRDGSSFTTRRVQAIQHGRPIFSMLASFQLSQESYQHQDPMPDVPDPTHLKPYWELAKEHSEQFPEFVRDYFLTESPIDQRPVSFRNPFTPTVKEPTSMRWVKANGDVPDDPKIHQFLLAYSSDYQFLDVSMQPHGQSWVSPNLQVASLDHSIYFHRPFRFDEWLLFVVKSPNFSGARGYVQAQIFNQQGILVASAIQEGLIRFWK